MTFHRNVTVFPHALVVFSSFLKIFSVDISGLVPLLCFTRVRTDLYYNTLLVATIAPVVVVTIGLCTFYYALRTAETEADRISARNTCE